MTSPYTPTPRPSSLGSTGTFAKMAKASEELREVDLREWLTNLWAGRNLVLGSALLALALGLLFIWRTTPIYQAEALLQIEPPKTVRDVDAAFARMENLFSEPSDASTEIEIIGSNLVIGRTVQALDLDLFSRPVLLPLIGEALVRGKADAPRADVETLVMPDSMRGLQFQLTALPGGSFAWKTPVDPPAVAGKAGATFPQNAVLAIGRPGELIEGSFGGEVLKLKLRRLIAQPGQMFQLGRRPLQAVIVDIRNDLEAAEKGVNQPGKSTNLLALVFRYPSPAKAAEILNEIMRQYLQQNAQRKSDEIARTLTLLNQQLPEVHARLTLAESRLNSFRSHSGSVDVPREAELALQQRSSLSAQISALTQKKEELLRIYQENSDMVMTVKAQIAKLESESAALGQRVKTMPGTQQELVRLTRDVQVNTELYTSLLNNIQHLQITQASEGHNTRIVDYAMPGLKPIKPKKEMLLAVFLVFGLFVGVGLVLAKWALQQGVQDHRLIETRLGLPVFATVPHSKMQEAFDKAILQRQPGNHLIALHDPDDPATESLRSLRTMLNFSMGTGTNHAIMITGPSPKIGKSFISCNLAAVLAQTGARVLLVDADMRRGNLHKIFGLGNRLGGLSEVIAGLSDWKAVVKDTEIPGLHLLRSGEIPNNPAELLTSQGFAAFVTEVSGVYDFVLFDAPPVLPVTDASIIGARVGTVLMVAKFGQHPLEELRTCQSRLESSGAPLKACIFNDLVPLGFGYYEQRYQYAYHYKYEKADNS